MIKTKNKVTSLVVYLNFTFVTRNWALPGLSSFAFTACCRLRINIRYYSLQSSITNIRVQRVKFKSSPVHKWTLSSQRLGCRPLLLSPANFPSKHNVLTPWVDFLIWQYSLSTLDLITDVIGLIFLIMLSSPLIWSLRRLLVVLESNELLKWLCHPVNKIETI